METLRMVLNRLIALFRRANLDRELKEELRAHIDHAIEAKMQQGLSASEARRSAMRDFGGVAQVEERYRTQRGVPWIDTLTQDLRYALRQLIKSPAFTATVVITLSLGVGAVTAVYSVVDGVLLRPYAFEDSGRVVVWRESIREIQAAAPILPDNYRHYLNLKAHASTIEDAAVMQPEGFSITPDTPGSDEGAAHPQEAEGMTVSANFFSVLGVAPMLGRVFTPEEAQPGKDGEVILTWGAWQRLYHGDATIIGKTLRMQGAPVVIVGVLPASFRFPVVSMLPGGATFGSTDRYEFFRPFVPTPTELESEDGDFNVLVLARLRPRVTIGQAQSELDGLNKASAEAHHLSIHLSVIVEPFAEEITGSVSKPVWLLFAAVCSVLLMACVNLANLQIARGVTRTREIALRSALGAGRWRLAQSVLIENILLGMAGGAGGILFAQAGERFLVLKAANLPRMNEIHLSAPMLLLALALSIVTAVGFGIIPALRSQRIDPQRVLQASGSRATGTRESVASRRILVGVEIACSVTLLIVTMLTAHSFSKLLKQERHFDSAQVAVVRADLSAPRYLAAISLPDDPSVTRGGIAREAMIDAMLTRLRSTPGVLAAAATSFLPLSGDYSVQDLVRPDHPLAEALRPTVNRRFITPGYFNVMRIALIAGRDFSEQDLLHPRVVILSQNAAQAAFPDEDPLGHSIRQRDQDYTVIGIAADARINDLRHDSMILYLPSSDFPPAVPVFLVHTAASADAMIPSIRKTIWSVDPELAIPAVTTLQMQVNDSVATDRFQAMVLSSFGMAALLIAVLGIYGVMAYSVSQRMQEFGVRIALGSTRVMLIRLVLRDASLPVLGGALFGLLGGIGTAHWIRSLLYQTSAVDPLSIALSVAVLLLAALAAVLVPVRKAASVDPMQALRTE